MSAVIVRNLPPVVHERLRYEAHHHHRSVNREIIAILEKELVRARPFELPPPVKPLVPIDGRRIAETIRKARDTRP